MIAKRSNIFLSDRCEKKGSKLDIKWKHPLEAVVILVHSQLKQSKCSHIIIVIIIVARVLMASFCSGRVWRSDGHRTQTYGRCQAGRSQRFLQRCCAHVAFLLYNKNNNNGDLYSVLTQISTTSCEQIKTLIKRENITRATKHQTIITIFSYIPSNNSHITMYTHRNPYSTAGMNSLLCPLWPCDAANIVTSRRHSQRLRQRYSACIAFLTCLP